MLDGRRALRERRVEPVQTDPGSTALQSAAGLKLITGVKIKGLTNPAAACAGDPCDPYCMAYPDTANGIDAGEGGVTTLGCGDASLLSVVTSGSPDASVAPTAVLKDAALADGEGYIYIQLAPNQTATREFLTPTIQLKNVDIYFLIDDGSAMGPAASNLGSALTGGTGIISKSAGCSARRRRTRPTSVSAASRTTSRCRMPPRSRRAMRPARRTPSTSPTRTCCRSSRTPAPTRVSPRTP